MLDHEDPLHLPTSNSVHPAMQLDGSIVIVDRDFDLVSHGDRHMSVHNLDRRMLGVQRLWFEAGDVFDGWKPTFSAEGFDPCVDDDALARGFADDVGQHAERGTEIRSKWSIPGVHQ